MNSSLADRIQLSPSVVVKAVIYNQEGRFLLQHRDNIAGIIEPNRWSLFGGGVEGNEALTEALERELLEELGCRAGVIEHELFRWKWSENDSFHVCFAVRFTASPDAIVLAEGQGFAWLLLSEMERLPLGSLVRENFPRFLSFAADKGFPVS